MKGGEPELRPLHPAETRLRTLLTLLVLVFLGWSLFYFVGPLLPLETRLFDPLPLSANAAVRAVLFMLACLYASGDIRKRRGLVRIVILALLLSAIARLILLPQTEPGDERRLLWIATGLDAVLAALLWSFYAPAREQGRRYDKTRAPAAVRSRAEGRLWRLLIAAGILYVAAATVYEFLTILPGFESSILITSSVVRLALLAMLALHVAGDLQDRQPIIWILITSHTVAATIAAVYLLALPSETARLLDVGGDGTVTVRAILWLGLAIDASIATALGAVSQAAWRARFHLRFLEPTEYRCLRALAEILVAGDDEEIGPEQVAANVERAIRPIRATRRWVYRVMLFAIQLHPLLRLRAPLSELDTELRKRHLEKFFYRKVLFTVIKDWRKRLLQAAVRVGKQLTYVGYYSDRRVDPTIGYVRFPDRGPEPPRSQTSLDVLLPDDLDGDRVEADICVIGTGAAGAILAYELAKRTEGTGKRILLVERGKYLPPREFSDDEVEMMGELYADGLFQQTTDFNFTILQGSCVGGTTVVNNAVCFDPPERILNDWNDPHEQDAGLDLAGVGQSVRAVRHLLKITPQDHDRLNPSAPKFVDRARARGNALPPGEGRLPSELLDVGVVEANIENCLGCGYCNIGCAYGRKLSMLDTVLPALQERYGDRVTILADCRVRRLRQRTGASRRVLDARARVLVESRARLSGGAPNGDRLKVARDIMIEADTFVVSAGAIASSYLLLRSGIGHELPVGERMSFNMGAPITADFDENLDAFRGLQISHYGLPATDRGFVVETWWNPPVAQAINMPGWFEKHFENMMRYRHLTAVGVLVGTEPTARVRRALTGGPDVAYEPSREDLRKLADGLALVSEIMFEAGARRVMLNSWGYDELTHPNQIPTIYEIVNDPGYLTLGTGHPQGGNAISRDPLRGVVDENFRVHGYENLYVCDASVFPSSVTVNPQLTVMGLAHYAGSRIQLT